MSSLASILIQRNTVVQTRRALLLVNFQNDYFSPEGALPLTGLESIGRLPELVSIFRGHGEIVWITSQFDGTKPPISPVESAPVSNNNDDDLNHKIGSNESGRDFEGSSHQPRGLDHELLMRIKSGHLGLTELYENVEMPPLPFDVDKKACFVPGTWGAKYTDNIEVLIDSKRDIQLVKSSYSAFESGTLIHSLRSRIVTELFFCGGMTDLCVLATALESASHGMKICIIGDCLGYRNKGRHERALKQISDWIGGDVEALDSVLRRLRKTTIDVRNDGVNDSDSDGDITQQKDDAFEELYGTEDGKSEVTPHVPRLRSPNLSRQLDEVLSSMNASSTRRVRDRNPQSNRIGNAQLREATARKTTHARSRPGAPHSTAAITSDNVKQPKDPTDGKPSNKSESRRRARRGSLGANATTESRDAASTTAPSRKVEVVSQPDTLRLQETSSPVTETMAELQRTSQNSGPRPLFGAELEVDSANSWMLDDFLPSDVAENIFDELHEEVEWQRMLHQTGEVPRLVSCQGTISLDGSMPVYRHPSDQSLPTVQWTPRVDQIRQYAEKAVGHKLNHCLIQLYRNRADFISEHSDKTLDIAKGTYIVNISFGAERVMRFRTKRNSSASTKDQQRTTIRVPLRHNSMLAVSLQINAQYLHGINADKRPSKLCSPTELAYQERRISLTFRNISTYLDHKSSRIWGQGAIAKTQELARPVINGDGTESQKLLRAFGNENQSSELDWDRIYGDGSDVLHLKLA